MNHNYGKIPYHVPTCVCEGTGWLDTKPVVKYGREYSAVARCHYGPPLTEEQWEQARRRNPSW